MHLQRYFGVLRNKSIDHCWQRVSSLRMRGSERQLPFQFVSKLLCNPFNAADLIQNFAGLFYHLSPGRSHVRKVLASPCEDFDAELVLK